MDEHVKDYYSQQSQNSPEGNFFKVIAIHEGVDLDWETIVEMVPNLPRGWYELRHLSPKDRIQFSLDYWLAKISYHPHINEAFSSFFSAMDDIGVFITQRTFDDLFDIEMVYSMKGNRGFYRGSTPAPEDEIIDLQKLFPNAILPEDYLSFLQIHNGFCKATDMTGITRTGNMKQSYRNFQAMIASKGQLRTKTGTPVDPKTLIPFYESFGMPYYQCFWAEWHPKLEMGNVYYSAINNTITNVGENFSVSPEKLAFPTFVEWLNFYLEQIEI
ncbi:MAG: SMI1/KNR4 family protein [Waddliaceae bacterium]